jgi:hypothetical protein
MTQEQYEYEAAYAAQAEAEYQAEMEYYAYLDKLIEDRQYQLYAIEIALRMLNSVEFAGSGLSEKDYLDIERKRLYDAIKKTSR